MIYADYAATSGYHPKSVINAVVQAMEHPGNAGRGAHEQALSAGRTLLEARMEVCELFDAPNPAQVVFTSGITASLNMVIKGILTPQDHVVTTWAEHNSVLRPLYELQEQGMGLTITQPEVSHIVSSFRENTRMVVMTHGSNVTGELYDIAAVGKACTQRGILFAVDTAQTAGLREISMKRDSIDILCFAGHKGLNGPQGIGGLCLNTPVCSWQETEERGRNIRIRPLMRGGTGMDSFSHTNPKHLPEALEVGTMNIPAIAGLAAAVREIKTQGIADIYRREIALTRQFYDGICNLDGVALYGINTDFQNRTPIVSLNIKDNSSAAVSDELEQRFGILTRSGAHCAPLVHEHFGTREQGMVRFSFGHLTTEQEIEQCIHAVTVLSQEA